MPSPPPLLPDELLEEIFLRLPPDEPACLVRASLSSKEWLGLLTGAAFCSRYREFHGAPPVLGFFYSEGPYSGPVPVEERPDPLFVSTKFRACIPGVNVKDEDGGWYSGFNPWDCRHGRVLMTSRWWNRHYLTIRKLVVLDPMTGLRWEMNWPQDHDTERAAVLCDAASCDHGSCREGPFRVVLVGIDMGIDDSVAYVHVSSPVTGESYRLSSSDWSKPCSGLHLESDACIQTMPPVLIQDALHFMLMYDDDGRMGILKYDLRSKCLSVLDVPLVETDFASITILVGMQDGSLGFAHLDGCILNVWSRKMRSDGVGLWTECRVIDLKEFLPIQNPEKKLELLGSVEGRDIILLATDLGIYEISLNSLEWKKIWKRENFNALIPYMSFYDP